MWLLEANTLDTIRQAEKSGFSPNAEQLTAFHGETSEEGGSRITSIAGDTADISIKGVLTAEPNFMAMIFGGGNTTYADIISAIASAEQNDAIKNIVLSVDSPGGQVSGLFNAVNAIASAKKPVEAIVINQAASAAYTLIAQANKISGSNEAAGVGSVGIATEIGVDEDRVVITSSEAPDKRPDVTTEAGKAVVREQLDAIHEILASSIAKGRGTTTEKVNSDFGRGTMVLAGEAIKRGMMDSISGSIPQVASTPAAVAPNALIVAESGGPAAPPVKNTNATNGENKEEGKSMNVDELKAQHGATFAAVLAMGETSGVSKERDRVSAHLTMGEASGDMATAVKAIGEGSEMTAGLNATYMAASMKKAELAARVGDNPDALDTPAKTDGPSAADQVADEVCAVLGFEEEVTA